MVPLDKNPGLRPAVVGEVLRKIAGKVVMMLCIEDVTKAAGSLQLNAGQDVSAEPAIHTMRDISADVNIDAVLLIDAENAFNSINFKLMLDNLKFVYAFIATYITNYYAIPSRLFIVGGGWVLSIEGTTQGDSTVMGGYVLGILALIKFLLEFINLNEMDAKEVTFADKFFVAVNLNSIKDCWDKLTAMGPKYGYFPKPTKSYLIVKEKKLIEAQNLFTDLRGNITAEGKRYLGAFIGSTEYRDKYVKNLGKDWDNQPTYNFVNDCRNATASRLHGGFKRKLNYFLRTIPNIRHLL